MAMLTESEVIQSVCRFLRKEGFDITRSCSETERGIDIEAVAPDGKQRVSIEAKGETSANRNSKRYGKPFNSGQVLDHVSKALYCAARDYPDALVGMAFPKNDKHEKRVDRILPALRKLHIEVFWVLADGRVEIEHIWRMWA